MVIKKIADMYFSQKALSTYEHCPLKFKYRYLDELYWPQKESDREIALERGRLFHLLACRYYSGNKVDGEKVNDEKLKTWIQRLKSFCSIERNGNFSPEYELRLNKKIKGERLKLVARFDLIHIYSKGNELVIYDWKTGNKSLQKNRLHNNYQTSIYLFIVYLAGNSYFSDLNLNPSDIKLIYWNPRFPEQKCEIYYNHHRYEKDRSLLINKIEEIKNMKKEDFVSPPGVDCKYCEYRQICG